MTARYIVKIIKFKCVDESGADFFGSDEPYWVFTANDGNSSHTTRSKVFGDVDSGDTRKFSSDAVVWPRKGASAGGEGPIGLSIQLWESDQGDADEITNTTRRVFDAAGFVPVVGQWVAKVPSVVREQLVASLGDDLMGSRTFLYPLARLNRQLRSPGDRIREKMRFGGSNGDLPFSVAGGPDYDLFMDVVRVADA